MEIQRFNMHCFILLIPIVLAYQNDPTNQLEDFKDINKIPIGFMTTSNGAMVETKHGSSTLNTRLIHNEYFMDSLTHLSRERIPERVVHANGAAAFGFFEVTHDISHICRARLFSSVGKKTPIAIRFSTIAPERGASNTVRDARGFAVKFYTEDGNLDIVGLNQPTFVLKDPLFFTTFAHTMKRNPATDLPDANMKWDFLTLRPESWNTFIRLFGDRGIFDGYRYMPGFSIHTYQVTNEAGTPYFVRFHFIPNAGEKTLTSEQAAKIQSVDPDYEKRDLYRAISAGNFPSWLLALQILSLEDVKNADIDVFDITKILPVEMYPLHHVGQLVLDRAPENFFAEVEQLAYNPANLVPGIQGGVDKLFEARRLSYRDALYYRLGANFNNIRVNCPFNTKPLTYNRDGRPPVKDNQKSNPNYHPNSFNGAVAYVDFNYFEVLQIIEKEPNNTDQIREFYLYGMSDEERSRLIENIRSSLVSAARFLQKRAIALFESIHPDFGYRVDQALASNTTLPF